MMMALERPILVPANPARIQRAFSRADATCALASRRRTHKCAGIRLTRDRVLRMVRFILGAFADGGAGG